MDAPTNPLSSRKGSVVPVLKSTSRTSISRASSASMDALSKVLNSTAEDVAFRPPSFSMRVRGSTAASAPTRSPSVANVLQRRVSARDLRRSPTSPTKLDNNEEQSSTPESQHAPLSRSASAGVRRVSQIEAQSMQVLKRTVSVLQTTNDTSTSPPATTSLLEIRGQIACRNMKQTGTCPFGARCHYRHDLKTGKLGTTGTSPVDVSPQSIDNEAIDNRILEIRREIACRNFTADGWCPFGPRCFYKHCDAEGKVVEETGLESKSGLSLLCFPNPHGDGDVSAAGVIPYFPVDEPGNGVWAVLQVEDMLDPETNTWTPALAMFGGKVGAADKDWLHTAAREFMEETGQLVGDLDDGVPSKMAHFEIDDDDEAFRYTKYLQYSKYQVLYYPVESNDFEAMKSLPARYAEKFKGEVSADWTRAATRLEPVLLLRDKEVGWAVYDVETNERHQLPIKVPLLMALKAAEFPPAPASLIASPANSEIDDIVGGELDSLLNISVSSSKSKSNVKTKSKRKPSKGLRRASTLSALSETPNENLFVLLGQSSAEIPCA